MALRCFVALCPDATARAALDRLARTLQARQAGSRPIAPENLHLTLAFIGALDERRAAQVASALRAMRKPAFGWTLDCCGCFERARVLWAGGSGHNERRLDALAQKVRAALDGLAIAYDPKPFRAHVTLLRDVTHAAAVGPIEPIVWRVSRPVLMVSGRDARGQTRYDAWPGRAAA